MEINKEGAGILPELERSTITFHSDVKGEVLKFDPNGDIFVKGKLIENDKEIIEALREFLKLGNSKEAATA